MNRLVETATMDAFQKSFFSRNGFIVIDSAISAEVCGYLVNETWKRLPPHWREDDPLSWSGDVTDSCHTADLHYRRGHIKFQKGALTSDPVVQGAFGARSKLGLIAQSMLGPPPLTRMRGLYCIAPVSSTLGLRPFTSPHVEAHPVHLIALTYLRDVEMGGGGLLVWPGSHRALHRAFASKLEHTATDDYEALFRKYDQIRPVELPGKAGDSVLIHHRLFHAPSLNLSNAVRFAMLTDYIAPNYKQLATESPGEDLWEDWPGVGSCDERAGISDFHLESQTPSELAGVGPGARDDTTRNKGDASRLVRLVRPGEFWLTVSTSNALHETSRIEPCGVGGKVRGLSVTQACEELESVTHNDFVAQLDQFSVAPATLKVAIAGQDVPLYCRIIRVQLPLSESEVLCREVIEPLVCKSRSSQSSCITVEKKQLIAGKWLLQLQRDCARCGQPSAGVIRRQNDRHSFWMNWFNNSVRRTGQE